ncbi:MAG: magnesium transporter [Melioribacteraceae bacterium]|nr:magnesium transporter [Melioribacteraceae bacterium]
MQSKPTYGQKILDFARKDFTSLNKNLTVHEALNKIRNEGVGERIVYFYVVDDENKLVGVLPTRRILIAQENQKIEEIMVKRVAALPYEATVYDALEFFATYKFLAFPVVDSERRILGIVDVNLFTDELLEEKDEGDEDLEKYNYDTIFETIGFRINEIRNASPLKAWRLRIPWLFATVSSGIVCALLTGVFQTTLTESIILVFFFTLVLGLGESISIQSMTVAIQTLRTTKPTLKWFTKNFIKEIKTASLLGLTCSIVVFTVAIIWKKDFYSSLTIGLSIVFIQIIASLLGLIIPTILHKTKLDPKIAAGPITLALADISTIITYFGLASFIL